MDVQFRIVEEHGPHILIVGKIFQLQQLRWFELAQIQTDLVVVRDQGNVSVGYFDVKRMLSD